MFRKIKKIYFKIYHLLKLLGIFIIVVGTIPIVKADVTTCDEFLISPSIHWTKVGSWYVINSYTGSNSWGFTTPKQTTVYLKFFPTDTFTSEAQFREYSVPDNPDTEIGTPATTSYYKINTNNYTLVVPGNSWTFKRIAGNPTISINQFDKLTEGTPLLMSKNLSDIENCTLAPNEPEPEKPVGNEVYNNFITMYVEKIKYLAEGFTSNSYLLAMIGIIISWIVLELFLKVFHLKGGYKK